ncbi:MAG: FkbM family methyltransferase [Acidobacteriota bacterium]
MMQRLLPKRTLLGGLARDVYRSLTPPGTRGRMHLELVLEALAYSRGTIFFIQVGSNDADYNDPLRPFILSHDWRGIMIEPVPYVFDRLQRKYADRDGLILENLAIAARNGFAEFYAVAQSDDPLPPWYDQLGSFKLDNILKHSGEIPGLKDRIVELVVPCLDFDSLCRKHQVRAVDVIHIDAEGYDFEIVKLIDFDAHRPTILLYEHGHLSSSDRAACNALVSRQGYECLEIEGDTLCLRREASAPWTRLGRAWRFARAAGCPAPS